MVQLVWRQIYPLIFFDHVELRISQFQPLLNSHITETNLNGE